MNSHHRLGISAQKSHYSLHRAYFIQRHSALITHYVLFSSQRAAFPIHFSDIPYASSTRIIKISIVLNFAPKPPHGTALVTEGQGGSEAVRGAAHGARRVISGGRDRERRRRAAEALVARRAARKGVRRAAHRTAFGKSQKR